MESEKQKIGLKHLDEFREVLSGYKPSPESLKILKQTPLVLLVGPTAAGRNTMIDLLVATGRYHYVVSDTTRPKRENNGIMEENGREYWFRSEDYFLSGLKAGNYLEAAVIHNQQVSGISVAELKAANSKDKVAIDEIEINGARVIHSYKPEILIIFLLPPNFETWMERLRNRGQMDDAELTRRLKSAVQEIGAALNSDYYKFVINNEIHDASFRVDQLVKGDKLSENEQSLGRDHAEQLAVEVNLYLSD